VARGIFAQTPESVAYQGGNNRIRLHTPLAHTSSKGSPTYSPTATAHSSLDLPTPTAQLDQKVSNL